MTLTASARSRQDDRPVHIVLDHILYHGHNFRDKKQFLPLKLAVNSVILERTAVKAIFSVYRPTPSYFNKLAYRKYLKSLGSCNYSLMSLPLTGFSVRMSICETCFEVVNTEYFSCADSCLSEETVWARSVLPERGTDKPKQMRTLFAYPKLFSVS